MSQRSARPEYSPEPTFGSFVAGREVLSGDEVPLIDPSTGRQWGTCATATPSTVEDALRSAQQALDSPAWRDLDPSARGALLVRFAELVEGRAGEMARLEVFSSGKTLRVTEREVARAAAWYRFFGGAADKLDGGAIELGRASEARILYEPVGVVVAITPSNGPISLGTWKIAPALATGNSVVVKPPLEAPASTRLLAELALEAGIPPGVLNVVPGGAEVGRALAAHSATSMVSFTGSTAVAKQLGAEVIAGMKRYACEAGGKSAQIVFEDADLGAALIQARQGVFSNAGQSCVAGARLLLQKSIYEQFLERYAAKTRELRVGDPFDPKTHIGPLASERGQQKVTRFVADAKAQGAHVLTGGGRPELPPPLNGGFYYEPTIVAGVEGDMPIWSEEVFGPVVVVKPFESEEEAAALANDSRYGLAAGIWTNDIRRAHRMARQLQAGTVWVNTYRVMHYRLPFGGYKDSGLGRENGLDVLRSFVNVKSIVTDHAPPMDAFAY